MKIAGLYFAIKLIKLSNENLILEFFVKYKALK